MAVITIAEFEKLKAQGWNSLDTTYDVSYKSHWTMWHAIREFFQNALDEHDEAGISTLPTLKKTTEGLLIADQGRGIGAEALLLRETKRAAGDLRGQFGEGLKFACITTLREGYDVRISSPLYSIRPILRDYPMVGKSFQIVSFLWKAEASSSIGTQILIKNYQGADYRERFFPFVRSPTTFDVNTAMIGRFTRKVSITTTPSNSLYVGDIFVRKLAEGAKGSPYSYNLWGINLNPDRDAETSSSQIHSTIAKAWANAPQHLIERLFKEVEKETGFEAGVQWDYANLETFSEPVPTNWRKAWAAVYGDKSVLYTSEEWARYAESYGYKPLLFPQPFANFLFRVIPTDDESVKKLVGNKSLWRTEIPDSQLTASQRELILEARRLTEAIEKRAGAGLAAKPTITVKAARFTKNPDTNTTVLGLWEKGTQTVSISDSNLVSDRAMLQILLHELGHWYGEPAPDLTAAHTNAVASVSIFAMEVERERLAAKESARKPRKVVVVVGAGRGVTLKGANPETVIQAIIAFAQDHEGVQIHPKQNMAKLVEQMIKLGYCPCLRTALSCPHPNVETQIKSDGKCSCALFVTAAYIRRYG